jgi:6-phosphogluconate dehydrogenase (decarboxylating)
MNARILCWLLELTVTASSFMFAVEMQTGQIISAGKGRITIMQAQDKEVSLEVATDAMVLLNNSPSTLDKLTFGDTATLKVETRDNRQVVTMVDAKSAQTRISDSYTIATEVVLR